MESKEDRFFCLDRGCGGGAFGADATVDAAWGRRCCLRCCNAIRLSLAICSSSRPRFFAVNHSPTILIYIHVFIAAFDQCDICIGYW